MRVFDLIGHGTFRESGTGPPGRATHQTAPAECATLLIPIKGECTVGDDRQPVRPGQGVMVEVGDIINLRATTRELEVFHIEFVSRP